MGGNRGKLAEKTRKSGGWRQIPEGSGNNRKNRPNLWFGTKRPRQTREAVIRNLGQHSGFCFRYNPLFASIDSLTSFSPMANDPLGHHSDRSPSGEIAEGDSDSSLLARNERRARSKREQRRLSEWYRIPSLRHRKSEI